MHTRWTGFFLAAALAAAAPAGAQANLSYTAGPVAARGYGAQGTSYPYYLDTRNETARAAALSFGRLFVGGYGLETSGESSDFIVARLTPDGQPDPAYNGGIGLVSLTPAPGLRLALSDMQRLVGDNLLLAGLARDPSSGDNLQIVVSRTRANGTFDPGFNGTGTRRVAIGAFTGFNEPHLAVQPDGKIVIAATRAAPSGLGTCVLLMRWLPDGTDDPGFGNQGSTCLTRNEAPYVGASGLVLLPDGRLVFGGVAFSTVTPRNADFVAARVLADGGIDTTFGNGGWSLVGFDLPDSSYDYASALTTDTAGRVVLAGRAETSPSPQRFQIAVVRLLANGTPDGAFGTGGRVVVTSDPSRDLDEYANDVAVLDDGRVLVAGRMRYPNYNGTTIAVGGAVLLRDDGSREPRFGVNGVYVARPTNGSSSPPSEFFRVIRASAEAFYLVGDGARQMPARSADDRAVIFNRFTVRKLARPMFASGFDTPGESTSAATTEPPTNDHAADRTGHY